jgi:type I restriction enzyme M protein
MLIDARHQFEKEPKSFGSKRNRMTDNHRAWIESRYRDGWGKGLADDHVKIFRREDFAYHKVGVVFWQFNQDDKPAIVTEPYEKAFTSSNLKKEQEFYDSDLTFNVRMMVGDLEKVETLTLRPKDNASKKLNALLETQATVLEVTWTHRHYVKDDEYVPYGENIEVFLKREIAQPIIRWEDTKKNGKAILGYEILPNKYFYRYQAPTPAKNLLEQFWDLENKAEQMLEGLSK